MLDTCFKQFTLTGRADLFILLNEHTAALLFEGKTHLSLLLVNYIVYAIALNCNLIQHLLTLMTLMHKITDRVGASLQKRKKHFASCWTVV